MVFAGRRRTFNGRPRGSITCIMTYTHQFNGLLGGWARQVTVGRENQGSAIIQGQDDQWYGTEQELTYKLSEKWSAGARYEWIQDNQGSRGGRASGLVLGSDRGWTGHARFTGPFSELYPGAQLPAQ